jgi:subtilisin family serine protease
MKKKLLGCLTVAVLAACGGGGDDPLAQNEEASAKRRTSVPVVVVDLTREVVVMLRPGANIGAVAGSYGATVLDQFGKRPIFRLQLGVGVSRDATLASMRADARIFFAEENEASETPEGRKAVVWAYGGSETEMAAQWAPAALALPQAHALSTGVGVRVAVLDSGLDMNHPALASSVARRANGKVLGFDFVDFDNDPSEGGTSADAGWGHGTHVSGLVALAAPGARIMPVRVLDAKGQGNTWVLAEALMWAIDPDGDPTTDDGAHVVNISLGTIKATRLLNAAVELATCTDDDDNEAEDDYSDAGFNDDKTRCNTLHGAVVMAAAGNGGSATEQQWPAAEAAEGQLSITATEQSGALASFANYGSWVKLAAPGDRIVSTLPGGAYGTWSGTSMSTPLASGVAALVRARNPDWKPADVTKRLLERSATLCGSTELRGLHAFGAVADFVPNEPLCP